MASKRHEPGETFAEVIDSTFGWLSDRGFRSTRDSEQSVSYQSTSGVFVRIFLDQRDMYLGFRVGLLSRPRDALTVAEVVQITGADNVSQYPESVAELRESATQLGRLLAEFGERILSGDETILDEAMALRREHTERFM